MQKTYSQRVARGFEILCYVMLVPALLSLIYPLIGVFSGILAGNAPIFFISLIPFLIAAPGFFLLAGYIKHSRGELAEERVPTLWSATAIYNFLLLLPWLYAASAQFQNARNFARFSGIMSPEILYLLVPVFGYILAIVFALKAYSLEKS